MRTPGERQRMGLVPPQMFDYVRTELIYVSDDLHRSYVSCILNRYISPGGRLLAAEYRARETGPPGLTPYLLN